MLFKDNEIEITKIISLDGTYTLIKIIYLQKEDCEFFVLKCAPEEVWPRIPVAYRGRFPGTVKGEEDATTFLEALTDRRIAKINRLRKNKICNQRSALRKALPLKKLIDRFNGKCCWCGIEVTLPTEEGNKVPTMATRDHLIPLSRGGDNDYTNIALSCYKCNHDRNDKIPMQ